MVTYAYKESPVAVSRDVIYPIEANLDRAEDTILWLQGFGQKVNGSGDIDAMRDTARGARVNPFASRTTARLAKTDVMNTVQVIDTTAASTNAGGYAEPLASIAGRGSIVVGAVYRQTAHGSLQDLFSVTKKANAVPLLAASLANNAVLRATARRTDGGTQATAASGAYTVGNIYASLFGFSFSGGLLQVKQLSSIDAPTTAALSGATAIPTWNEADDYYLTLFNRFLVDSNGVVQPQVNRASVELDTLVVLEHDWTSGDVSSAWYKKWFNILMARRQAIGGGSFTPLV